MGSTSHRGSGSRQRALSCSTLHVIPTHKLKSGFHLSTEPSDHLVERDLSLL